MTRKVSTAFLEREDKELKRKELEVSSHNFLFNFRKPRLLAVDESITKAIELIQASKLEEEQKTLILTSIEQLETSLMEELDHSLMIRKYYALAEMLEKIVVESSSSVEEKQKVFDTFLEEFKAPSSKIQNQAKLGLAIGLVVLVLGLGIAAYFLFQLIPFTAFFTMIGLSGAAVTIFSNGTSFVGQMVLSLLATWGLHKFNEVIYTPLCNGIQRMSQEYRDASSVKDSMSHLLFARESIISDKEQASDPLLELQSPLEI